MKTRRIIWTVAFLSVTLAAIVMEVIAGMFHVEGTIPWTEYLAQYVPWPFQLAAYVALAVWLPFHFWRHDHLRKIAYQRGRIDAVRGLQHRVADEPLELVKYALHLRMYGENAPGGNETWKEFDRRAEEFLRGGPPDAQD